MTSTKPVSKESFIQCLLESGVLTFGDFTLKSGRKAPYFVNTGNFDSGSKICKLAAFYAQQILAEGLGNLETVFGPAYKGIPLCVATAQALYQNYQRDVGFSFNRKEAKTHGDVGTIVGKPLTEGMRIVIVEDVLTAGTTLREVVSYLRGQYKVQIEGVVLAVDRCERGVGQQSARHELEQQLGLRCFPIVTVHDLLAYLDRMQSANPEPAVNLQLLNAMKVYVDSHAV